MRGKKICNPIFKESPLQANLVFLLRYLCLTAFHFLHVAYFVFEWKMKFIKGLCHLDETNLHLTHLVLACDGFYFKFYFILIRSGPILSSYVFVRLGFA